MDLLSIASLTECFTHLTELLIEVLLRGYLHHNILWFILKELPFELLLHLIELLVHACKFLDFLLTFLKVVLLLSVTLVLGLLLLLFTRIA